MTHQREAKKLLCPVCEEEGVESILSEDPHSPATVERTGNYDRDDTQDEYEVRIDLFCDKCKSHFAVIHYFELRGFGVEWIQFKDGEIVDRW